METLFDSGLFQNAPFSQITMDFNELWFVGKGRKFYTIYTKLTTMCGFDLSLPRKNLTFRLLRCPSVVAIFWWVSWIRKAIVNSTIGLQTSNLYWNDDKRTTCPRVILVLTWHVDKILFSTNLLQKSHQNYAVAWCRAVSWSLIGCCPALGNTYYQHCVGSDMHCYSVTSQAPNPILLS